MSWLRANLKYVIGLLLLLTTASSLMGRARWKGVAEAEGRNAARQTVTLMQQAEIIRRDSIEMERLQARLDSASAADAERVDELDEERRAEDITIDSLNALVAAQIEESGGWVRAETHEQVLAAERRQTARWREQAEIEAGRADRAESFAAEVLRPQLGALGAQVLRFEDLVETQNRQITALENALSPSFGLKLVENWELPVAGVVVGIIAWEALR